MHLDHSNWIFMHVVRRMRIHGHVLPIIMRILLLSRHGNWRDKCYENIRSLYWQFHLLLSLGTRIPRILVLRKAN